MAGNHRSGRKPKPDALRALEGGRARGQAKAPTVEGRPEPPELVANDPVALRYWTEYADILGAIQVLGKEHREALATLACVSAEYERAREDYAETGFKSFIIVKGIDGLERFVETPFQKRLEKCAALKVKLLGEFGLTPTMAAKVARRTGAEKKSKWAEFSGRGRAAS